MLLAKFVLRCVVFRLRFALIGCVLTCAASLCFSVAVVCAAWFDYGLLCYCMSCCFVLCCLVLVLSWLLFLVWFGLDSVVLLLSGFCFGQHTIAEQPVLKR